jgi:predicted alpha/beta hydrolase
VTVAPIEFNTCDGLTLRGDLYEASGPSAPAVVMSGGFSVVRDMALPRYAEALCAIGITVLCYDHRNLGESDGEPRQEINPWAQSRDMICAIDVLTQDDPERPIGLWGSTYNVVPIQTRAGLICHNSSTPSQGFSGSNLTFGSRPFHV